MEGVEFSYKISTNKLFHVLNTRTPLSKDNPDHDNDHTMSTMAATRIDMYGVRFDGWPHTYRLPFKVWFLWELGKKLWLLWLQLSRSGGGLGESRRFRLFRGRCWTYQQGGISKKERRNGGWVSCFLYIPFFVVSPKQKQQQQPTNQPTN